MNTVEDITKEDKVVATKLEIEDRVYCTSKRDSFITVKDHKAQFMNNPKFRVINPTKSELGMVSMKMLAEIILSVKTKAQLLQFKNADSTIDWFSKLERKEKLHFIQFDVVNFYASISPKLLENSVAFAARHTAISENTKETIMQAAKSFLYSENTAWIKKVEPLILPWEAFMVLRFATLLVCIFSHNCHKSYQRPWLECTGMMDLQSVRLQRDKMKILKKTSAKFSHRMG